MHALGLLFDRYVELIFGVCLKYLKDPVESEDATMEIFDVLRLKLQTHKVDAFRSWLYVLTRNHCLQILRKRQKSALTEDYDDHLVHSALIEHPFSDKENFTMETDLQDCLEKLPLAQKQSIELFYFQTKSYQEIALLMTLDKEQVRSHLQNGRRNLRQCIDKKNTEAPAVKNESDLKDEKLI